MIWLNANAPAIQVIAAVVTLALTAVLAYATWKYANNTQRALELGQRQLKAANEQSEALQKPFVTVELTPRDAEDTIFYGPNAAMVAQRPTVVLYNLGVGPALNVSYRFRQINPPEGVAPLDHPEFVPSMRPSQNWVTSLPCKLARHSHG